ncbi:MAG: hypothetical protein ACTTHG_02680 [Treponemataceae bacterium]
MDIVESKINDAEFALIEFISSQCTAFSINDIENYLAREHIYLKKETIEKLLSCSQDLIKIDNDFYLPYSYYLDNAIFSIFPTKKEIEEGYLIIGHRTMPYTRDPYSIQNLKFFFKQKKIQKIQKKLLNSEIIAHYNLFGDEYLMNVLSSDPANISDNDISSFFDPNCITSTITVLDLADFYKKFNFKHGDRIICINTDLDGGEISIAPLQEVKKNPFVNSDIENLREIWYKLFEKSIIQNCKDGGPDQDIYHQLLKSILSSPKIYKASYCGSCEELISRSSVLELRTFGVGSRIWPKDLPIAIIKKWNDPFEIPNITCSNNDEFGLFKILGLHIRKSIVSLFIKDSLFYEEDDISKILDKLIPDFIPYEQEFFADTILKLEAERSNIQKDYNKFADFPTAELRHEALKIYCDIIWLLHEIRLSNIETLSLNQQALLMIMDIVTHLSEILIVYFNSTSNINVEGISASINGMRFCLDENSSILYEELKSKNNNFKILKQERED